MANVIYTTNSKSMLGAGNSSPKEIPNPELNKDIAHVVPFDNGNLGGLFATVRHNTISYEGQSYVQYRLYFLPDVSYKNAIITFSVTKNAYYVNGVNIPGEALTVDLEPLNTVFDNGRSWLLAKRILTDDTKSDFLVNDITKIQSLQNNVNTNTTNIPQDILAILYNQNTDIVTIDDIELKKRTLQDSNISNINGLTKSDPTGSLQLLEVKGSDYIPYVPKYTSFLVRFSPNINIKYTMDQANREFNRGNKYANFQNVMKHDAGSARGTINAAGNQTTYHQGFHPASIPYTDVNDIGYPESEDKSYWRYGPSRDKLFFKPDFMRSMAYDKAVNILTNNVNSIDTPALVGTLNQLIANKTIRDASNEDLLQGEAKVILDEYIKTHINSALNVTDDRIKKAGITSDIKLIREQRKKVYVLVDGVYDGMTYEVDNSNLSSYIRYNKSSAVNKDQSFKEVSLNADFYDGKEMKVYAPNRTGYSGATQTIRIPRLTYFRKKRYPVAQSYSTMTFDYDNFQLEQEVNGHTFKNFVFSEKELKTQYTTLPRGELIKAIAAGGAVYDTINTIVPGPDRLLPAVQNYVKQVFNILGPAIMIRTYMVTLNWNWVNVSCKQHSLISLAGKRVASPKTKFKNKNNSTTINISGEDIELVSLLTM